MSRDEIVKELKELDDIKEKAKEKTICHYWRIAAKLDGLISKLIKEL